MMFSYSIMGQNVSLFPTKVDQIEWLTLLLDVNRFALFHAFPSVLWTLYHGRLLPQSLASKNILHLKEISFQRVVAYHADPKMSSEDFLERLIYQLMHLVDLLPALGGDIIP